MNTVEQGNVGLGRAIAYFTSHGDPVCILLNDTQAYDLVIEEGGQLKTVQVKTSNYMVGDTYVVQLKTVRPNKTQNTIAHIKKVDYVFIHCFNGDEYLLPWKAIQNSKTGNPKTQINLSKAYLKYKV